MKLTALALATLLPCMAASPAADKAKAYGSPSAPITIEIFSDFACPHCRELHEQVLPQIMKDFVANGKVFVVMREFPFINDYSRQAACYAVAAARIGKYDKVAEALFTNQAKWAVQGNVWNTVAGALDPQDRKKVQELASAAVVVSEVQNEKAEGMECGVGKIGTPTLRVTYAGRSIETGVDRNTYPFFKRYLDGLAQK